MASALTAPFAAAALLLWVAALAKLRSPRVAATALSILALPSSALLIRGLAVGELALGAWCLLSPGGASAGVLAAAYGAFAILTLLLARRRAACGCFGEHDAPASVFQSLMSATFALVAVLAAVHAPHGIGWIAAHDGFVLAIGITGAAYAAAVVYVELPRAWSAWSGR